VGEVVVVTGASAGVGRAVVRKLAGEGASIGLVARGRAGLDGARREVEAHGGHAVVVPADVADHDQVEAAAARIEAEAAAPETLVVADGFSCKTQIEQGRTGRRALHVAEVIQLALDHGSAGPPGVPERALRPRPTR
jgi:short-subunit dehydrogenase